MILRSNFDGFVIGIWTSAIALFDAQDDREYDD